MAQYRITCTEWSPTTAWGHRHIVAVGVNSYGGTITEQVQSVDNVRTQIALGWSSYYTKSPTRNLVAAVEPFDCCGIKTLRSSADAVADNNLDNLDVCRVR